MSPSSASSQPASPPAPQAAAPPGDGLWLDGLRSLARGVSRSRREPEWLGEAREEALSTYASLPVPDRVGHLWRYTDPQKFFPAAPPEPGLAEGKGAGDPGSGWPAELEGLVASGELAGAALLQGGRLRRVALDPALARAGVVLEDLHQAARDRAGLVRAHLGALLPAASGKFEALNAALWRGGVLVHVPRGVEIRKPIHLLTVLEGRWEAPRLLVIAGEASELTVIDEYTGPEALSSGPGSGAPLPVHAAIEVFGGESARLRTVTVQRLSRGVALHVAQRARLLRDSKLVSVWASLGGSVTKADLGTVLAGRGAEVELLGFLFGEGRQHFDHHTVHDHQADHTHSDLDFKVVLKDRARSAYTGLIRIAPHAPNSEAYQENRNLLLSEGAKADSIPELEILTDEVMCTHGATMGSLDPEHVFYLVSRGIPRPEAARMVVGGFIEPTLTRLPEDLRERLRRHVEAGLLTM